MTQTDPAVGELLRAISALPKDFHTAGSLGPKELEALVRHSAGLEIRSSAETGCGISTLLLSHLSAHHLVFALEATERYSSNGSVSNVFESSLLNRERTQLIDGPTQRTLPQHRFEQPLQLALIDGPHAYPYPDLEYYYLYPQLERGALLIVDDIRIPSIHNLFQFLRADEMFTLLEVVRGNTAFFRRTDAPTFDPYADDHWLQNYNKGRVDTRRGNPVTRRLRHWLPASVRRSAQRARSRFLD